MPHGVIDGGVGTVDHISACPSAASQVGCSEREVFMQPRGHLQRHRPPFVACAPSTFKGTKAFSIGRRSANKFNAEITFHVFPR